MDAWAIMEAMADRDRMVRASRRLSLVLRPGRTVSGSSWTSMAGSRLAICSPDWPPTASAWIGLSSSGSSRPATSSDLPSTRPVSAFAPTRGTASSGVELDRAQVVVVGNARGIGGRYRIGHGVMTDALDADGIWAAIGTPAWSCPSARAAQTSTAGWSMCSSSARPARMVRSAAGATRCWTIPTCTGTAGSRPRWVERRPR